MSFTITKSILIFTTIFSLFQVPSFSSSPHLINFKPPNLYPNSLTWDPKAQHFILTSLHNPTLISVSDAGVVNTLVSDTSLPPNSSFLDITIDVKHNRVLAVVHTHSQYALAAYDLHTPHHRQFLTTLHDPTSSTSSANGVTVDFSGNAFVTNSASNSIWKVNLEGEASVLTKSRVFTKTPLPGYGLNGIAYCTNGYLIVAQSNTGFLYKVDSDDGSARKIKLNKELTAPEGIAIRRDGVLVVVSQEKLYFIKTDNSWSDGAVYDETALDSGRFPTSVTVGAEDRVYVLYGHVEEGILGNPHRDEYSILEVRSEDESGGDAVVIYVLIGFGLAYFLVWRFQMRQLVSNMNKKIT